MCSSTVRITVLYPEADPRLAAAAASLWRAHTAGFSRSSHWGLSHGKLYLFFILQPPAPRASVPRTAQGWLQCHRTVSCDIDKAVVRCPVVDVYVLWAPRLPPAPATATMSDYFCLSDCDVIGFDLDHTLCRYHLKETSRVSMCRGRVGVCPQHVMHRSDTGLHHSSITSPACVLQLRYMCMSCVLWGSVCLYKEKLWCGHSDYLRGLSTPYRFSSVAASWCSS